MEREPRLPLAGLWGERASTASWSLPRSVLESRAAALCPGLARCPWWQHRQPQASPPVPESFTVLSSLPWSLINLLHLPDDLLFKDGQDGVILPHLLKDHTTVKLIAHFLEVIPEKTRNVEGGEGKKSRRMVTGQHNPQTWLQPFHDSELLEHRKLPPQTWREMRPHCCPCPQQ